MSWDTLFKEATDLQDWTAKQLDGLNKEIESFNREYYPHKQVTMAHTSLNRVLGFLSVLNQKHMSLVKNIELMSKDE